MDWRFGLEVEPLVPEDKLEAQRNTKLQVITTNRRKLTLNADFGAVLVLGVVHPQYWHYVSVFFLWGFLI